MEKRNRVGDVMNVEKDVSTMIERIDFMIRKPVLSMMIEKCERTLLMTLRQSPPLLPPDVFTSANSFSTASLEGNVACLVISCSVVLSTDAMLTPTVTGI